MILVKYQVYVYKYTTNESFSNTVPNFQYAFSINKIYTSSMKK